MQEIYIFILVLLASFTGTVTGFGTSTILVPFMVLAYPFPEVLLFVGVVHWFGDIWKMLFFKKGIRWRLILLFGVPGVLLAYLASGLPGVLPEEFLRRALGVLLVVYVLFIFTRPDWRVKKSDLNASVGGALSGFFAGLFGVGGAVRSTFLSAFDLEKSVYIFTSGAIAFLIDSARIAGYLNGGVRLENLRVQVLVVAVFISLGGAYLAKLVVDKVPQGKFRFVIGLGLFAVGVYYLQ